MTRAVVVGSGIAGASAAYHLAAGGADVLVVDDARPGQATAAGAGIIAPLSTRPASEGKRRFMVAAAHHYLELARDLERAGLGDHSYASTGQLIVALDSAEQELLPPFMEQAEALTRSHGTKAAGTPELLDRADVMRRFPALTTAHGGVWMPEVGRVDGRIVRERLLSMATRHGAEVIDAHAELVVTGTSGGVQIGGEPVECDHVVLAAGVWSAEAVARVGVELAVYPQRGQIVHLRTPAAAALPVLTTFRGHYLVPFPGDRMVIGATREDDSGFDLRATAGGVATVIDQAIGVVPELADAEWLEVRVGIRPASRDGEPFVGPAPGVDGLWLASGFGPQGLTLAPLAGRLVAAAILGEAAEIPADFAPGRQLAAPGGERART